MKKFAFVILFLTLTGAFAKAAVQANFAADKMTIAVQGNPDDLDAMNFFTTLNIVPTDQDKFVRKQIRLDAENGERLLDVQCDLSKTVQNAGSCAVRIYKSHFAVIDAGKKEANLMIAGKDAEYFAKYLVPGGVDGDIFSTADGRFAILVYFNGKSRVQSIQFIYRE